MTSKKQILGCGGLGDAAMIYAKIYADYGRGKGGFELTHAEVPHHLLPAIREFYNLQGIPANVIQVPDWEWLDDNQKNYDVYYETDAIGGEPFPPVARPRSSNAKIVVVPSAGRVRERKIPPPQLQECLSRNSPNIYVMGEQKDLATVMGILGSADVVISPIGFCVFISCMMRKKVFVTNQYADVMRRRTYPEWDLTIVDDVGKVQC